MMHALAVPFRFSTHTCHFPHISRLPGTLGKKLAGHAHSAVGVRVEPRSPGFSIHLCSLPLAPYHKCTTQAQIVPLHFKRDKSAHPFQQPPRLRRIWETARAPVSTLSLPATLAHPFSSQSTAERKSAQVLVKGQQISRRIRDTRNSGILQVWRPITIASYDIDLIIGRCMVP